MNTLIKLAITITSSLVAYLLTLYFLNGDSHYRHAQKKRQYFVLGLFFAVVAAVLFYFRRQVDTLQFLLDNSFVMMLLSVAVIDLLSQYIYDAMLLFYSIIHLVLIVWQNGLQLKNSYGIITGVVFYGILYIVTHLIYKREAFGMGDVLFLAAMGVVLDAPDIFAVGLLAFYVSLPHLLIHVVVGRALKRQAEIAFAPSMAIAGVIIYFFKASLFSKYMLLFWG